MCAATNLIRMRIRMAFAKRHTKDRNARFAFVFGIVDLAWLYRLSIALSPTSFATAHSWFYNRQPHTADIDRNGWGVVGALLFIPFATIETCKVLGLFCAANKFESIFLNGNCVSIMHQFS